MGENFDVFNTKVLRVVFDIVHASFLFYLVTSPKILAPGRQHPDTQGPQHSQNSNILPEKTKVLVDE